MDGRHRPLQVGLAFVSFALLCLASSASVFASASSISRECGGILTLEEDGQQGLIEYKLGQPYDNNELCIWTVRAPQSNKINFRLQTADFESGFDYLNVHSYTEWEPSWVRGNVTDKVRSLGQELHLNGPLAFVVFSSDMTVTGTGFQLFFEGSPRNTTGAYPINCNHTDVYSAIPNGARDPIHIPQEVGQPYGDYELTSIVLAPPNPAELGNVELTFTRFDLNEFDDRVYVYEVSRRGWSLAAELRTEGEAAGRRFTGRSFIVVFRTYKYYTYMHTGFTIE